MATIDPVLQVRIRRWCFWPAFIFVMIEKFGNWGLKKCLKVIVNGRQ